MAKPLKEEEILFFEMFKFNDFKFLLVVMELKNEVISFVKEFLFFTRNINKFLFFFFENFYFARFKVKHSNDLIEPKNLSRVFKASSFSLELKKLKINIYLIFATFLNSFRNSLIF